MPFILWMRRTRTNQAIADRGWIKKGKEKLLALTLAPKPVNINGVINLETLTGVFQLKGATLNKEDTADVLLALRNNTLRGGFI